jgi:hypothetical protein
MRQSCANRESRHRGSPTACSWREAETSRCFRGFEIAFRAADTTIQRVKLPDNSIIPESKLTGYLLVPQARADKSRFLARAGYTANNPERLMRDLRDQILPMDATAAGSNRFGEYFTIRGLLRGPNGVELRVKTIWMLEHLSGQTRFITLVPDKQGDYEV